MIRRILGIDPGITKIGWAILDVDNNSISFVASGLIKSKDSDALDKRLLFLSNNIDNIIKEYNPTESAVEDTYVNNNARTSLMLGQARGAIVVTIAKHGIDCTGYEPRVVKKAITGKGSAEKEHVQHMLKLVIPNVEFSNHDAADAIAIAYCKAISFCDNLEIKW